MSAEPGIIYVNIKSTKRGSINLNRPSADGEDLVITIPRSGDWIPITSLVA